MTGVEFSAKLAAAGIDADWLRARSIEEGECWIWQGYVGPTGHPIANVRSVGPTLTVRRIAAALAGRPPGHGQPVRVTCNCRECVNPDHAVPSSTREIGRIAAKRGAWSSAARAAKISASRRKNSSISDEAVMAVRLAERGTLQAVCDEYGLGYSTAKAIRSGRIRRRDYSSPWAGMGAR